MITCCQVTEQVMEREWEREVKLLPWANSDLILLSSSVQRSPSMCQGPKPGSQLDSPLATTVRYYNERPK